jgi:hypothetical protein
VIDAAPRLAWPRSVAAPIAAAAAELGLAIYADADGSITLVVARGAGRAGGIRALGWASVEIERAARDLGWSGAETAPDDLLLGARAAVAPVDPPGRRDGAPGPGRGLETAPDEPLTVVLLEPSTEGLLAGALARNGEGPVALYVAAPRAVASRAFAAAEAAGGRVIRADSGPLGPAALVRQPGPPGPFLVVVYVP